MNIKFINMHLHNFASYQDAEIDLSGMGFTLVSGKNNCILDGAYSNGAGKSAIFNGLCFALTGETTQGISSGFENIFSDPDDCWVRLEMMVDEDEFVIKRVKTPKQNLIIELNGKDISGKGVRESSQVLENYLSDLTSDIVNGIIILGQGLPRRFTNNKPSHRKELLENLTKSDFMIQSIKDKLETRMTALRSAQRDNENEQLRSKSQLEVYTKQLEEYEKDLKLYDEYSGREGIENKINLLTADISSIDTLVDENNTQLLYNTSRVNSLKAEQDKIKLEIDSKLSQELKQTKDDLKSKNREYIELSSEIKTLKHEISCLESITDVCPTCKQKLSGVVKPDTDKEKENLKTLEESLKKCSESISHLEDQERDIRCRVTQDGEAKISEIEEDITYYNKQSILKRDFQTKMAGQRATDEVEIYKLKSLIEKYDKLSDEINKTKKEITKHSEMISSLELKNNEINSRLDILQQMMTLAKREFRGILLSSVIEYIDRKVKQYSLEVFGTDQLSFALDDNYINITYGGKLYENLSGGEKQKIDVIVQLALRDMLSRQLNLHFNVLVLDEIYDGLDAISCQKISNLIFNLSDIDSIFIISHHVQDLEITYDNILNVVKSPDGISTLSIE